MCFYVFLEQKKSAPWLDATDGFNCRFLSFASIFPAFSSNVFLAECSSPVRSWRTWRHGDGCIGCDWKCYIYIYTHQMASLINRENMWKSWYTSETWMTGAFTLLGRCRQILVFLGKKMQLLHQKFGVGLSRIQKRWKILQKHQNHHIKVLSLGILQQNRSKVIASARDQRLGRNCSRLRLETYERVARDGSGDWKMVVSWRLVWIIIYQMLIQDTLW